MIVVTAGNYQVKRPQDSGIAPADHGYVTPAPPDTDSSIFYNAVAKSNLSSLSVSDWLPPRNIGEKVSFSEQPVLIPVHYEDCLLYTSPSPRD